MSSCCWYWCCVPVLLSDSGGPVAVDIHDVPVVSVAAAFSGVNSVPAVLQIASLHAVALLL